MLSCSSTNDESTIAERAVGLINFYFHRHIRRADGNKSQVLGPSKRQRQILLFQIQYYPLFKRLLGYLLGYVVRRRYWKVKRALQGIQVYWRGYTIRHQVKQSLSMEIDYPPSSPSSSSLSSSRPNSPKYNGVCPSPAISLRGFPLMTEQAKRVMSPVPLRPALRHGPANVTTPRHTNQTTKTLLHEWFQQELPNQSKMVIEPTLSTPNKMEKRKGPRRVVLTTNGKKLITEATKSSLSSPLSFSSSSLPVSLPDETEWAIITAKNTLQNAGYRTCELIYEEVIREGNRPSSPSSHFCIEQTPLRKWASPLRARESIQRAWSEGLSSLNSGDDNEGTVKRKIQWNPHVSFVDVEQPRIVVMENSSQDDNPFKVKPAIRPNNIQPIDGLPHCKYLVKVQRILYSAELPSSAKNVRRSSPSSNSASSTGKTRKK